MRRSTFFLIFTATTVALLAMAGLHARHSRIARQDEVLARSRMVREYQLTDLCLFTEARYTRHPAMADQFAPFQDHPASLEHFPSGSLVAPPAGLVRRHEQSPR